MINKERKTESQQAGHGNVAAISMHRSNIPILPEGNSRDLEGDHAKRCSTKHSLEHSDQRKGQPRMLTSEVFEIHKKNPTLALLRQRNLPFIVACLQRSFADVSTDDVTEPTLKNVIAKVQEEIFEQIGDTRFEGEAQHYIDEWAKVAVSSDLDRPWLATRMSPTGQRIFTLLPAASEVLGFFDGLEISKEYLTNSALNELVDKVLHSASRLSGNPEHRRAVLLKQKEDIEAEIERLDRDGLPNLDDFDRAEIASSVSSLMSQITTAFRSIPGQVRKHTAENREIYHTAVAPKHEILTLVAGRNKEKRNSPEFRVVRNLYGIRRDKNLRAQFENAQGIIEHECMQHLGTRQLARMKRFLNDMADVGHDIHREDAQITKSQLDYIRSSSFRELRDESAALRDAQEKITTIRDTIEPGLNDRRLDGVGITLPMPMKFAAMVDLKLATAPPVEMDPKGAVDEVLTGADEHALRQTKEQARKGLYLSVPMAKERIRVAMDNSEGIRLSDLIKVFPLQYGAEEISNYLALAGGTLPSRYEIGGTAETILCENVSFKVVTFPNPFFLRSGTSAQGIDAFVADIRGELPRPNNNTQTREEQCNVD
jgi:hypothetical protein